MDGKHPQTLLVLLSSALALTAARASSAMVSWADAGTPDEGVIASTSGFTFSSGGTSVTATYALIGAPSPHPSEAGFVTYEATQASSAGTPYLVLGFDSDGSSLYEGLSLKIEFGDAQSDLFFDLMDMDLTVFEQDGLEVFVNGSNINTMPSRVLIPGGSAVIASDQPGIDGWVGSGPGSIVNTVGTIGFDLRGLAVSEIEIRFIAGDDALVAADPDGQRIGLSDFGRGSVPEPSSLVLCLLGTLVCGLGRGGCCAGRGRRAPVSTR